jgi:hypothetical protein
MKYRPHVQFQLDGNLGYVAGLTEMVLQSHIPGSLILLPALPLALAEQGTARGLQARGDIDVSFTWRDGDVAAANLLFRAPHPWLRGVSEDKWKTGFFSAKTGSKSSPAMIIRVFSPNRLQLSRSYLAVPGADSHGAVDDRHLSDAGVDCASTVNTDTPESEVPRHWLEGSKHVISLRVSASASSFPCVVILCSSQLLSGAPAQCDRLSAQLHGTTTVTTPSAASTSSASDSLKSPARGSSSRVTAAAVNDRVFYGME